MIDYILHIADEYEAITVFVISIIIITVYGQAWYWIDNYDKE